MYTVNAFKKTHFETPTGLVDAGPLPLGLLKSDDPILLQATCEKHFTVHRIKRPLPRSLMEPKLADSQQWSILRPKHGLSWIYAMRESQPLASAMHAWIAQTSSLQWYCNGKTLSLRTPLIMGIWNLSPDSFSSSAEELQPHITHALSLVEQGADVLDIGAESSNPHSKPLNSQEEMKRLLHFLPSLREHISVPLSLDSYHLETMLLAKPHIDIINDIGKIDFSLYANEAQRNEAMAHFLSQNDLGYVRMLHDPHDAIPFDNSEDLLVSLVQRFASWLQCVYDAGVDLRRIVLDPGIGFGKGLEQDAKLLLTAYPLRTLGRPILIGHSRKRFLGMLTDRAVEDREHATTIASTIALQYAANVLRVHTPSHAKDAIRIVTGLQLLNHRQASW